MLTDAQLEQYKDRGYVIPDFRLPEPVLEDLRADQARLVERHPALRTLYLMSGVDRSGRNDFRLRR